MTPDCAELKSDRNETKISMMILSFKPIIIIVSNTLSFFTSLELMNVLLSMVEHYLYSNANL